jgi:hypothetical protein
VRGLTLTDYANSSSSSSGSSSLCSVRVCGGCPTALLLQQQPAQCHCVQRSRHIWLLVDIDTERAAGHSDAHELLQPH